MVRSFTRTLNALNAGYSYLKSSLTREPFLYGMPVTLSVELTNYCNLNCPECLSGSGLMTRARGFMKEDLFDKIINELSPYLLNLNLYFQGEPMLHPLFFTFLEKCQGIYTTVSTNGHFISAENAQRIVSSGLRSLIISLDGMDDQVYSLYRKNGDFKKVQEGIKNISVAKRKTNSGIKLAIQFLVNKNNEHQIHRAGKYAREMGAELNLKSMQITGNDSHENWLPSKMKFRRYEKRDSVYVIKNSFPDRCSRLWFNPVVLWNGKVLPCCFDKDADHIMGDLNEESFSEIWNGPRYRIFRKRILSGRKMTDICRNCTSGLRGIRY